MPLARPGIHETVLGIFQSFPKGRVLDCPAGEGALSEQLAAAGFDVQACDLNDDLFRVDTIEIKKGDLCGTLPYPDQSFDYIASLEGLEHLDSPPQAFREYRRLLKPGGQLVISVPNIMNIEERVKWLLFGYTSHFKPFSEQHQAMLRGKAGDKQEIFAHIHPIGYTELRYLLERNGFAIQGVYRDAVKKNQWLYWPITTFIRLLASLTSETRKRDRWTRELSSDPVLLGGNTLILHSILR